MHCIGEKHIFSKDDEDCEAPLGTTSVSNSYGVPVHRVAGPVISQRINSSHRLVPC